MEILKLLHICLSIHAYANLVGKFVVVLRKNDAPVGIDGGATHPVFGVGVLNVVECAVMLDGIVVVACTDGYSNNGH